MRTPSVGHLLLSLTLAVSAPLAAQERAPAAADTAQNAALRAFFDCDQHECDRDFLVTELTWVNWMRDRLDADFHILVTRQSTGSGGRRWSVVAIGQRNHAGRTDTLEFTTNPNDANDLVRREMLRVVGQLLLPYAARGPLGPRLTVAYAAPTGGQGTAPPAARDKWDFWTYSISGNGFLSGESRQSSANVWTGVNANRTTEEWKIRLNASYSFNGSKFTYDTTAVVGADTLLLPATFTTSQRNSEASALVVRSLGEHWSAGGRGSLMRSDFSNTDLATELGVAVEWDYFPYREFARRKLAVLYGVLVRDARYQEVTIYGRLRETRPQHAIEATLAAKQRWGSANITLEGSQYLDALTYYNLGMSGNVDVRLGRGFSFNVGGRLSRVRDQLFLPASGLTPTEVVARQQALATDYRYSTFFGIRYQFGSIFNSVVNPRFGALSSGGGMMITF